MSVPFPGISGVLGSPWRGTVLPEFPLSGQLFFLDVSNEDGRRGWYRADNSTVRRPRWELVARAPSDQGDLVRPGYTEPERDQETRP